MTLPYHWDPGAFLRPEMVHKSVPEVGDVMPYEHKAYRVERVDPRDDGSVVAWVRDTRETLTGDPVADARRLLPLSHRQGGVWWVYAHEHYPVCGTCLEPLPCRELVTKRISAHEAAKFNRYTTAGVCPACSEPVSSRQKSVTWEDNAVVPGGPPVTFHLRRACFHEAVQYERRWYARDPGARRMRYTCGEHHVRNHGDGTYSCTNPECPGPTAWHQSWTTCDCPEHSARTCTPPPDARRV